MSFKSQISKRPLLYYVLLNYVLSWSFLYPAYQAILNAPEGTFPWIALVGIPGGFGPTISALIICRYTEGRTGMKNLLSTLRIWKVHLKWYLVVLIFPVLIYFLAVNLTTWLSYDLGPWEPDNLISNYFVYLMLALPFGPLMEELGWRGYMLPRLLANYGPLTSSLILGLIWSFWHTASFTFPGAAIPSILDVSLLTISLYTFSVIAQTLFFTYIYLKTRGSVIIAILLHTAFNASSNIILSMYPTIEEIVDHRMFIFTLNASLICVFSLLLLKYAKGEHDLPQTS